LLHYCGRDVKQTLRIVVERLGQTELKVVCVLTIETWLNGIGLKQPIEECPSWPPDLYALAGGLIRRSGAYLRVFEHRSSVPYLNGIEKAAEKWRKQIDGITAEPVTVSVLRSVRIGDVLEGWASLIHVKETAVSEIRRSKELAEQLIRLTLLADEASVGIGIDWDTRTDTMSQPSKFLSIAEEVLVNNELQSFCWEVPRDVLCVLGKQHTPAKGATFRSLSHHLGRASRLSRRGSLLGKLRRRRVHDCFELLERPFFLAS
jgi:hypothetical protein